MTNRLAFKSQYWKIKQASDFHIARQSFYDFDLIMEFHSRDRMSWKAWIYLDCDEGDHYHWNNRMLGLLR